MDIKKAELVYFSPTGTTEKVLKGIAKGLGEGVEIGVTDVTLPVVSKRGAEVEGDEGVVILGAPVYAGRISATSAERLAKIEGKGRAAVVVVVYGNRAFDDAMLELSDLAEEAGFKVVAGGAFIGEHSFSTSECELAVGRPDAADVSEAEKFGGAIAAKMKAIGGLDEMGKVDLPGNKPYKDGMGANDMGVTIVEGSCVMCGACVEVCPVGAIEMDGDEITTDNEKCILCGACVRACPVEGRVLEERVAAIGQRLKAGCTVRCEPEVYV